MPRPHRARRWLRTEASLFACIRRTVGTDNYSDVALRHGKQTHHHDKNFTCIAAPRVDGRSPRKASRHMVAPPGVRPVSTHHASGGHQVTDAAVEVMPRLMQTHESLVHVESKALNREAQERWDDDGGASPLNLGVQTAGSEHSMIDGTALVGANDKTMLLNHLEVADRYFAEAEQRVVRQQNLISKLRAKRQNTLLAVEFLRGLQASRVMRKAGCSRLQRALATLEGKHGAIQPSG